MVKVCLTLYKLACIGNNDNNIYVGKNCLSKSESSSYCILLLHPASFCWCPSLICGTAFKITMHDDDKFVISVVIT